MEPRTHTLPGGIEIQHLTPNRGTRDVALTPDVEVLCINRGAEAIEDMFDSIPYVIPPGYFKTTFGAAQHFRARAVVPGSRNPETSRQSSFVAIIGVVDIHGDGTFTVLKPVDKPEEWTEFTVEERAEYESEVEALDRAGMTSPIDREVVVADIGGLLAGKKPRNGAGKPSRVKGSTGGNVRAGAGRVGGGTGQRAPRGTAIETTDEHLLQPIPPEENPTVQEIAKDRAAAAAEGHRTR